MEKRLKIGAREIVLRRKYGSKFDELSNIMNDACRKVTNQIKIENLGLQNSLVKKLVKQRTKAMAIEDSPKSMKRKRPNEEFACDSSKRALSKKKVNVAEDCKVNSEDLEIYKAWEEENVSTKIPVVSIPRIMALIEQLKTEKQKDNSKRDIQKCISHLVSPYESFWNSSQHVIRGLQSCLLTRNWDNMTYLLLMLINRPHSVLYLPVIKKMCEIMVEFNPLVQELGLAEQFKNTINFKSTVSADSISASSFRSVPLKKVKAHNEVLDEPTG